VAKETAARRAEAVVAALDIGEVRPIPDADLARKPSL
jgi:hypothetical protein